MRVRAMWGLAMMSGAMLACDTVNLGTPPAEVNACRPDPTFFYEHVWPEFLGRDFGGKHCADSGCHDAASPRELRLPPPASTPALPLPPDWEAVYRSASQQMFCTNVGSSPLLLRPSSPSHGGKMLIAPDGPEAALIRMWVQVR